MSEIRHIKHPFKAVIDKDCKCLILGSVPSIKSVENNFYYMHKDNRFWKVLSVLLNTDLYNADISTRIEILLKNHIALYDAVEECDILGSSDSKISNIIPADIKSLIGRGRINKIFCAGSISYNITLKNNKDLENKIFKLPSTSPANAKLSLQDLINEWSVILESI